MKKLSVIALLLCVLWLPAAAEQAGVDAVSSASVTDFYGDGMLSGDALMDAINSYSGFYAIASADTEGTPNLAFFIYGCVKEGDAYFLQLGLSPNQTTANIEAGSEITAMYAALPAEGAAFPTSGARMRLRPVADEALLAKLLENAPQGYTPMYWEITEVRPLG